MHYSVENRVIVPTGYRANNKCTILVKNRVIVPKGYRANNKCTILVEIVSKCQ